MPARDRLSTFIPAGAWAAIAGGAALVEALQSRLAEMAEELVPLRSRQRRDVAVIPNGTAVAVWQPRKGSR
jgi:hypothetical protein